MNKVMWSLNFMYSMERFATAIYRVQKGGFKNATITEKLIHAVENEHQHAVILSNRIIELKNKPFILSFLFQLIGFILGCASRCYGNNLALKTDVAIEKRAVKDYSYFLRTLALDDQTKLLLERIIADEELHIKNWQDSIKLLESKT